MVVISPCPPNMCNIIQIYHILRKIIVKSDTLKKKFYTDNKNIFVIFQFHRILCSIRELTKGNGIV